MSVCILSLLSQSKSRAYDVAGAITTKARKASSNLMVKAHHLGRRSPTAQHPIGRDRRDRPKSHREVQNWHHLCTSEVHARMSKDAIEVEWRPQTPSVAWGGPSGSCQETSSSRPASSRSKGAITWPVLWARDSMAWTNSVRDRSDSTMSKARPVCGWQGSPLIVKMGYARRLP